MTLIASQHNKLGGAMGTFTKTQFEPRIYSRMKDKGDHPVPYVNHSGRTPNERWAEIWDSPRYSSGYATPWHTFAFVPETHMLKPYPQRVTATYELMLSFIDFTSKNSEDIRKARAEQKRVAKIATEFPVGWTVDRSKYSDRLF